ncbi:sorting nexin lst-4 [Trichonephila inaurata madagascariensis]|uniref:Sorting nexin lst-4 n=1 Tax=Trichonephila inaurata madagascariensis TaxID=2747483 RepID=A0A8X6YQX4_9ARAC|nr:sorting nexin lst-4 [Trichonephila inaurata madagascariensis]
MAVSFQVRALYDFDAQDGTGELSIAANEILTVTNQDVGEGWWEGVNSRGQKGLFPAGYVEATNSPPPPAMPPPPPPADAQITAYTEAVLPGVDAVDDWDDDWDDDDSDHTGVQGQVSNTSLVVSRDPKDSQRAVEARGTLKKSFNRFSTFVKSGGEGYILGETKLTVPTEQCVTILENNGEITWLESTSPYTCSVDSPNKKTKLKGLKSFIAYQLIPSFNNIAVSRRYKHFDWLHERLEEKFSLIPIPPLPDKQISGRYEKDFIDHRKNQLQMWVNRICRHPVLSQSEVWMHFLTCTDDKRWKVGKRNAEKDKLIGGSFFHAISTPSSPLENGNVEKQIDLFNKFVMKMDDSVKQLFGVAVEQHRRYAGPVRKEIQRMSESFNDLGTAFQMYSSKNSDPLTTAIKHTASVYDELGKMYEEQPKYDAEPMADVLHEYKGMLAAWPDVLHIQKSALNKVAEHKKLSEEGKISQDDVAAIDQRTDVISYATLAEINHFHNERVAYFKSMMETYLTAQIDFYQRITQKLQETLTYYQNS